VGNLSDTKLAALRHALGVADGQVNDLEMEYLASLGFADGALNDRWLNLFRSELAVSGGQFNTLAAGWLESLGYMGQLNEKWLQYWNGLLP